jgi:hypothetical protein
MASQTRNPVSGGHGAREADLKLGSWIAAENTRTPLQSQAVVPRYVRIPNINDDLHVIGHDLVRIGPELAASIRRVAEGGAL